MATNLLEKKEKYLSRLPHDTVVILQSFVGGHVKPARAVLVVNNRKTFSEAFFLSGLVISTLGLTANLHEKKKFATQTRNL